MIMANPIYDVVNISVLKGKRREDLEILLSIFDQKNRKNNIHILNRVS